jgi:DNA-binding beta-propeller fold protein YncE
LRLVIVLCATTALVWSSGSKTGLAEIGVIGSNRIVARAPLIEGNAELCLMSDSPAANNTRAAQGAAPSTVTSKEIPKPARVIQDRYHAFAGVAVDPGLNEVVFADENLSSIVVYDRLANSPPNAVTPPKRAIRGERTFLEYVSAVYIDPKTADIYGVNNDTMNWLPIFGREANGNVPADGLLATPHTTFGIAVDEAAQEMFLTIQDDHAVVVFDKHARDPEENPAHERRQPPPGLTPPSPVRILQGIRTRMADPHGVAFDPRRGEIFVANWGTGNKRPSLPEAAKAGLVSRGRKDFPVGRVHGVPSSGYFELASITVYPKGAAGDTPPSRVIQGPRTQLNWPTSVAVHPARGELFVANDVDQSILVFRADAQGDVAPFRVLKGPRTLMQNPTGVAVDTINNELWVASLGNHTGTVYRIDAAGDTPPLRVIRSAPTGTPSPMLSNAHTVAFDSKRDEILVAN